MEKQNYNCVISANISATAAVDAISSVTKWWGEDVTGSSKKQGDIFTIRFGTTHVTFKITELIPEKEIVWLVTDCHLPWLNDKTEWTGTSIAWNIENEGDSTQISMTHVGLQPEVECYDQCEKGWNFHIKESLLKLLTEDNGMLEKPKEAAIQ